LYYIFSIIIYFWNYKINLNCIFNSNYPPAAPVGKACSHSKGIYYNRNNIFKNSINNSLLLHHFSTKATNENLNNKLPVLINSKEILDNYHNVKLPLDVLNSKYSFSPWFIVGFVEAEGNFDISISANSKLLPKFRFRIALKYIDIVLLCAIKNYFGSGSIFFRKDTQVFTLEISSQEVIENKIIPLFDSHPLKGTKYYDYLIWRDGFKDFLLNKDLDSRSALIERIKERKLKLNRLKLEIKLPIEHLNNIDVHYISGFVSGDGSFSVVTGPNSFHTGFGQTVFLISQHIDNKLLIEHIMKYFKIGYLGFSKTRPNEINYRVARKEDLIKIIIPFFETYHPLGVHSISFYKFKNIINYILESKKVVSGNDRKLYNNTILIPKIKSYWLNDNIYFLNNDLSLNKEKLDLVKS